ncbi:hypothetical protein BKA70DRAFT_1411472 [Coprinopsis sp. MPI-PUGE-AT-0042]|nr:hypothetical protein BKA70DRAFT_1411472 [Coprinopsis sp. MPI-PUGE-AT-0042]
MVFWTSDVSDLVYFFHDGYFDSRVPQDIISLAICAFFSAIQAQIMWRLYGHLKAAKLSQKSPRSSRVFGVASMALGVGFIVCTILLVTTTVIKLEFVAKRVRKKPRVARSTDVILFFGRLGDGSLWFPV